MHDNKNVRVDMKFPEVILKVLDKMAAKMNMNRTQACLFSILDTAYKRNKPPGTDTKETFREFLHQLKQ